jgi:gluconokinase
LTTPDVLVVMGAAGSGKTTVGRLLAESLGWRFVEGDDLHPTANVRKMSRGEALTDEDRAPWLEAVRRQIEAALSLDAPAVVACSALKASHRRQIAGDDPRVKFVYLRADRGLLRERLEGRRGHFFPAELLASQLESLEEPPDAITVDASLAPEELTRRIRTRLGG